MKLFVTGASGFIGGAIARAMAAEHDVSAMSRSTRSDDAIGALGATPIRADLASLEAGDIPACDAVVHCAAFVEPWGTRERTWEINVEGTSRALAAARAAGARRFLHMSTEAVLWHGQDLVDVDETHPYAARTPYLYSESKAEAERRVVAANEPGVFETLSLRPRFVWGPGDQTLAPEIKAMVAKGAFLWIDQGRARTSTTHIANLVHGARLVLERGTPGEIYFVTDGESTSFRDFLPEMMKAHGVELGARSIPSAIARPAAAIIEGVWRTLRLSNAPPLTRHAIDLMCCDCTLDISKIQRELGYAPVISVEEGLRQLRAGS